MITCGLGVQRAPTSFRDRSWSRYAHPLGSGRVQPGGLAHELRSEWRLQPGRRRRSVEVHLPAGGFGLGLRRYEGRQWKRDVESESPLRDCRPARQLARRCRRGYGLSVRRRFAAIDCPRVVDLACGLGNPHTIVIYSHPSNATNSLTGKLCTGGGGYDLSVSAVNRRGVSMKESALALGGSANRFGLLGPVVSACRGPLSTTKASLRSSFRARRHLDHHRTEIACS